MTLSIALLLIIIVVAVALFSLERLPTDVIALFTLLLLILTGLLPPEEAFAGFGSDTVVMIFGLLVLTAALMRTGVVDTLGNRLLQLIGDHTDRVSLTIMVTVATLSAFMSNTASAALFVPVTLGIARRLRISASKLLMPLAFAAILASSVTLVSSSTNIVISGLMTRYALEPLGMFELALVGIPIAILGLLYMLLLGNRLIPVRESPESLEETFGIRPYLAEVVVLPDSPLIGKSLAESNLARELELTVLRIIRDKKHYLTPRAKLILQAGDELLVKGQHNQVLKVRDAAGLAFKADVKLSDPRLQTKALQLAEVILLPPSPLIGKTLKGLRFRQRYGLQILGLNRRGKTIFRKLSRTPLQSGDQLLIQGRRSRIEILDKENTFHVLGAIEHEYANRQRAPLAIGIFVTVLLLATLKVLSLPVAVLVGALAVFVTHCITPETAYRTIEWKALLVIGSMLALGIAMESTGTAAYLAHQIITRVNPAHATWLLSAFFFLTLLLTQPMSNQAAAVVVLPVALQTATQLGLNPRTFAIMIAVGASCSFITPLEPACLLVYGPGRYRFMDFVKVGFPLTILIYLVAILLVPLFWPL